MSDDTRERIFDSVQRPLISAEDTSGDSLTTITIKVEKDGEWFELEFKSKSEDVEESIESLTPAELMDGLPPDWAYNPEPIIRAWPGKRINRFSLRAIPVADPVTGIIYVKRYAPHDG